MEKLASEKVILAAPMSFTGSRARIWQLTAVGGNVWLKWLVLAPLAVCLIAGAWCAVFAWYCIFGIFLVPWRLFRRGQRKDKKRDLQHKELMDITKNQP